VKRSVWIGWDPRERAAYGVALSSLQRHLTEFIPVHALAMADLIKRGLYTRPTENRDGLMWDVISDAPMSTEHACGRFLTPHLAKEGWALFMDGDVLVRDDLSKLFDALDPKHAVYCVKHDYEPSEVRKMDNQVQQAYARKNWSSVMAFNVSHPANNELTIDLINTIPGRDLHRFCWLEDKEIGSLHPRWNHLVGVSPETDDVAVAHFTLGLPDMPGWADQSFADEWRAEHQLVRAA